MVKIRAVSIISALVLIAVATTAIEQKSNHTDFANSKAVNDIMNNSNYNNVFNELKIVRKFREDLIKQPTIRTVRELKLTTPKSTRNFTAKAFN